MTDVLNRLVGSWTVEATHPMTPSPVSGRSTFEWLEGEHFLLQRSQLDHRDFPDSLWVIGEAEAHYFDSRGVRRAYESSVSGGVWRMSRDEPEFSQRFEGSFSEDGDTFSGQWQLSRDGETWDDDAEFVYRRA